MTDLFADISHRCAESWRKRLVSKPGVAPSLASNFLLEPLEPRLLLSADLVPLPDTSSLTDLHPLVVLSIGADSGIEVKPDGATESAPNSIQKQNADKPSAELNSETV